MADRAPAFGQANFQRVNDESRERLASLISTLTPTQLAIDLGGGWTVASVLAHLGFFDRFHAERWTEMLAGRWSADDESLIAAEHLVLKALDPYWAGMDSPDLSNLALEATARLDALIANALNATVDAIEGGVAANLLHLHRHRGEHIDQIERSIVAAESAAESAAPTVDRPFIERNAESRRRLADLVGRLAPADMARDTAPSEDGSWNVAQVLGPFAFWDRSMEMRWLAAKEAAGERGAFEPASLPSDVADAVNLPLATLLGAWTADIGVDVGAQALAAAEAVDSLLESLVDRLSEPIQEQTPAFVQRWRHRELHLEAVEKALAVPR